MVCVGTYVNCRRSRVSERVDVERAREKSAQWRCFCHYARGRTPFGALARGDKYTVFKFAKVDETGGDGKSISQRR